MAIGATPPIALPAGMGAVGSAIRHAAQATGASFDYLLATARVESSLNPNLSAKTSSARGLFQFIEQTWLGTLKQAGADHGYGRYADAITRTRSGRYVVTDPALRREILDLRKDPAANAVMAGVFTKQNATQLTRRIGRQATEGELYVAHFLGVGGASKLIKLAESNPNATAAEAFPQAARANRPIFYDRQGQARSLAGVYGELVRRYEVARAAPTGTPNPALAELRPPAPIPNVAAAPDTAAITGAYAAAVPEPAALRSAAGMPQPLRDFEPALLPHRPDRAGPLFLDLYRPEESRTTVAPVVTALWGVPPRVADARATGSPAAAAPSAATPVGAPLDLFQNMRPDVRALYTRGRV